MNVYTQVFLCDHEWDLKYLNKEKTVKQLPVRRQWNWYVQLGDRTWDTTYNININCLRIPKRTQ